MAATYTTLLVERREAILLVTLNREAVRNAIDRVMVTELHALFGEVEADATVRAIVLQGAGDKAFAAGADIRELLTRTSRDGLAAINTSLFERLENLPCPTIAAVRGFALGGGLELALACDLRVAGRSSRMGQPEVSLGIIPGAGATYRLPRLVGQAMARELIFTGRVIDANEALAMGLVNRVVDDADVLATALEIAGAIAKNGATAVRLAKLMLNAGARGTRLTELESVAQAVLFDSEEKRTRMQAFLDKSARRDP